MLSPVAKPPLLTGQRMSLKDFLRRWDELPDLKKAELMDGVVYVPPAVSSEHGSFDSLMIWRLAHYAQATPGWDVGNRSTWLMPGSAPEPDTYLRIFPSSGGQSGDEEQYCTGAPELAVEICVTSMLAAAR